MRRCLTVFLIISTSYSSPDSYCTKRHRYDAYGFDISCEKMDSETLQELSNTHIDNPSRLTISNSNLTSVSWQIFHNLPKLKEVYIVNSTLVSSNIFEDLQYLKVLSIENSNVDISSYRGVNGLSNLIKLTLVNNNLSEFKLNNTLDSVATLNLNDNKLSSIEKYSPCKFPNIDHLYLQNNFISNISDITCIQNIEKLYLDHNNIEYINLTLPYIEVLSLSYNRLEFFKSPKLPLLTELNLEGNKISLLEESTFQNLPHLIRLNLRNNKLSVIPNDFLAHNLVLSCLNLHGNQIQKFNVDKKIKLDNLDLSHNQLNSIDFLIYLTVSNSLDLSSNTIEKIPKNSFSTYSNLKYLNLSHNNIGNNIYSESFNGLESLEVLDLSNAKIKQLANNSFISSNTLKILNISNNEISNFVGFERLHSLVLLNISHNKLKSLSVSTLKEMKYLNTIDLDGNQLTSIDYVKILQDLPIRIINIRNNSLSCEFLAGMISYFRNNSVSYSHGDFNEENVYGISCREKESKSQQPVLNRLQAIDVKPPLGVDTVILIISLSVSIITVLIVIYSLHIRCRRRYYLTDEIELL